MKCSFTTLGCPDWSLEEIVANGAAYGYDGVELRTNNDGNHLSPDADDAELAQVAATFTAGGLPVTSVMGYTSFAHEDEAVVRQNQDVMGKLIHVAEALGAPFIRTFAGRIPDGAERQRMVETVANAIRPLAQQAADKGIVIGLETHDDWCAGQAVRGVIDQIDSSGFGVVYDIYNAFISGLETWDVTYAAVKEHIAYCHLKDGYDGPAGRQYVLLGAGDLPLATMLARFKADGYDGFFSFEWEKKWHPELEPPERALPQFAHKLRALWDAAG